MQLGLLWPVLCHFGIPPPYPVITEFYFRLRNLCTTPDLDHDHHSFEVHCSLGYDQCWVRAENNLFSLTATSTGHCPEKNQDFTYSLIPSLGINWYVSLEVVVSTVKNIVFVMSGQEQDNSLIHTFDAIVLNHEEVQKFHTSLISYFVLLSILWGVSVHCDFVYLVYS